MKIKTVTVYLIAQIKTLRAPLWACAAAARGNFFARFEHLSTGGSGLPL